VPRDHIDQKITEQVIFGFEGFLKVPHFIQDRFFIVFGQIENKSSDHLAHQPALTDARWLVMANHTLLVSHDGVSLLCPHGHLLLYIPRSCVFEIFSGRNGPKNFRHAPLQRVFCLSSSLPCFAKAGIFFEVLLISTDKTGYPAAFPYGHTTQLPAQFCKNIAGAVMILFMHFGFFAQAVKNLFFFRRGAVTPPESPVCRTHYFLGFGLLLFYVGLV